MTKLNYFDTLETLARLILQGVSGISGRSFRDIKEECDRLVFSLEEALFSDFITPLERDNIAEFAHSLYRILDKTNSLHFGVIGDAKRLPALISRAIDINRRLCAELADGTVLLKHLKKPDSVPDLAAFRKLSSEGQGLREDILCALKSGKINNSYLQTAAAADDLRLEITRCFDKLVEIMLNNI